jgi:hypothetical protein
VYFQYIEIAKKENRIDFSQKQILKNDSIENVEFESIFLTSAFSYLTLDREPKLERNQTEKKQKRNKNKDKKQNTMKKGEKKLKKKIIIFIRTYHTACIKIKVDRLNWRELNKEIKKEVVVLFKVLRSYRISPHFTL